MDHLTAFRMRCLMSPHSDLIAIRLALVEVIVETGEDAFMYVLEDVMAMLHVRNTIDRMRR